MRTTDWTYVRFHGPSATVERPTAAATAAGAWRRSRDRLGSGWPTGIDVYAYFNNDYEGHAVADAEWLADRLEARPHLRDAG